MTTSGVLLEGLLPSSSGWDRVLALCYEKEKIYKLEIVEIGKMYKLEIVERGKIYKLEIVKKKRCINWGN